MAVSLYNIFGIFKGHDNCTINRKKPIYTYIYIFIYTDVWIAVNQLKVNVNLDGFYISAW